MVGPDQASPAQGAVSTTDSPQSAKENAPAEKPARFAYGLNKGGGYCILQHDGSPPLPALCGVAFDLASDAASCVKLLNALDAERRGDNPADVQRQVLEELRELVKLQRDALKHVPETLEAAKASAGGSRPEPNVNDLMLEVGRAFGLSDLQTMNLDNLKGFCCAASRMQHVPQKAKRPLLLLVVRGALDVGFDDVACANAILKDMGLA